MTGTASGSQDLSPQGVAALVDRAGQILRLHGMTPPWGLLLVGSRALGTGAADSNVNLLVIDPEVSSAQPVGACPGTVRRPTTLCDNIIVEPAHGAPEISIEVVGGAALHRLAEVMAAVEVLDNPDASKLGLPAPDLMEIRLLARLISGTVLEGAGEVAAWRDRMHVSRVPSWYVACTFEVARHYYVRAQAALADGDRLSAALVAHTAAEHLAFCAAVPHGLLLHESKKLGAHIGALRALQSGGPEELPRVLLELEQYLWTPVPELRIRLLAEWADDLLDYLRGKAEFGDAIAFLCGGAR